jgi:hypothetical protein
MRTAPAGNTRGTGGAAGGEMGAAKEAMGGVIRVARGEEVKAGVIGATCGAEGEVKVIMVTRGEGEIVGAVGQGGWTTREGGRTINLCNTGGRPPRGMV